MPPNAIFFDVIHMYGKMVHGSFLLIFEGIHFATHLKYVEFYLAWKSCIKDSRSLKVQYDKIWMCRCRILCHHRSQHRSCKQAGWGSKEGQIWWEMEEHKSVQRLQRSIEQASEYQALRCINAYADIFNVVYTALLGSCLESTVKSAKYDAKKILTAMILDCIINLGLALVVPFFRICIAVSWIPSSILQ